MVERGDRYTFDRVVRTLLSAAILVAVLLLLWYLSDVLIPFAAAVVLAYLLNPLVNLFVEKTHRRGLAVAISIVGIGVAGAALLTIVIALTADQVSRFSRNLEGLRHDFVTSVSVDAAQMPVDAAYGEEAESAGTAKSASGWRELKRAWIGFRRNPEGLDRSERFAQLRDQIAGTHVGSIIDMVVDYTESEDFKTLLADAVKRVAAGGATVAAFIVNTLLGLAGLIIVLLYLIFLLLDFPEYSRAWKTFLPPNYRESIVGFLTEFDIALRRYFRGQAVVALLMGVLFAIGFSLIGLPMAVPLGLFIGLLNMVPYLQTVGLVPALLLAVVRSIEGESSLIMSVVLVLLVFAVAQLIQDSLITPRIMGKATGLKPVAILLGVFIWGKLLGFLGLLLAIPLTCLAIAYYRRYVLKHTPETASPTTES